MDSANILCSRPQMWSDRYQTKSQPYSPSLCIILNSIILYGSVLSKGNIRKTENIMRSTLLDAARYEIQFFCIYCWQLPFQFSTFTFVCLFPIPIPIRFPFPFSFLVFLSHQGGCGWDWARALSQWHCGQQIKCCQFRTQKAKANPSNWIESRESLKIH